MSCTNSFLVAASAALILGTAGAAAAQTCTTDADCPTGLACTGSINVATPEPACPPDAPCPKADASAAPPAAVKSCEPKACAADSDCGAGMVCHAEMSTSCSGSGESAPCARDQPCDASVKTTETCTTTTTKVCAFKWQLPCNMDSDCGDGFTCAPSVTGACSGGGGVGVGVAVGPSDAAAGSPPPDPLPPPAIADASAPMCMTMTSFPGWCQPKATSCATDADCPALWKCIDAPGPVTTGNSPGTRAPTPAVPDGGIPPAVKVCSSPYGGPLRGGFDGKGEPGMDETGSSATHGGDGGTQPPVAPGASNSGADAGAKPAASKSGGCSMGAGAGSSGLGLATLVVGLAVARRRRRR